MNLQQLLNKIPSTVTGVRSASLDRFLTDDPGKMKVLLMTSKATTPLMMKVLSFKYASTISFGIGSQSDSELVKKFGISQFPTLFVWPSSFSDPKSYKGNCFESKDLGIR